MVHDCLNCEVFKRTYELSFVMRFIPQAMILLYNNLLIEFGFTIFATFKNSLLVELYLHLQTNKPSSLRNLKIGTNSNRPER